MADWELLKAFNEPRFRTEIVLGDGGLVKSLTTQAFNFSATAGYGNLMEDPAMQQDLEKIKTAGSALLGGKSPKVAEYTLKNQLQTIAMFNGSEKPAFSVEMLFLNAGFDDPSIASDPRVQVKKLLGAVYTETKGGFYKIPYGYKPSFDSNEGSASAAPGTCTLKIGTWFIAVGLLITGVTPNFSREVASKNGYPMYATCGVQFTTWRLPDKKEMEAWFPG